MPLPRVGLVDYGMGNLHSVSRALATTGVEPVPIESAEGFDGVDVLVLPGVGHFGEAMKRLDEKRLSDPLRAWLASGKPFLGICLGMQLLFETSEEAPGVGGLGRFAGTVKRFPAEIEGRRLVVPAIGWNRVEPTPAGRPLFPDGGGRHFYFVHSYYVAPADEGVVAATAEYGLRYACAVAAPNLAATQFHPEKSGERGLALLKRIISIIVDR